MNKLILSALLSLFAAQVALAQAPAPAKADAKPAATAPAPAAAPQGGDCAAMAAEKKLAGAAKGSFMKKCESDAKGAAPAASGCEEKAVGKNGKKLAGAAKTAFMKKCEADAKPKG